MSLFSRSAQLEVPLAPAEVLARLEAELRGVRGPMLERTGTRMPSGQRWVGHVEGARFVVRRAAVSGPLVRNLHAITRGQVEATAGGSRLSLLLRPAWLDSPPWTPLLLLSLGGVGLALWDRKPGLLGLVLLLWCVPLALGLLARPLLGWEEREVLEDLRRLLS
ncbi:hypothetical protein FGE12_19520 [Aggregicoccus sp. 17bor-14]|uniref:hypothetical protein n=1 Tax=Myxococcaceae TaxID=31 RepID=UPI00129C68ED|nr:MULTISPECIES: hypothetical protein [Myxococcaceae]MBF5044599.1 hypothetical protein [Simulacricoccus sp. 17bor-14]MRI90343.1 hypothetical protein [Aggregicoccus sp. 17bor-14]